MPEVSYEPKKGAKEAGASAGGPPVFIVGVMSRSGTNFLGDVIELLPEFRMPRLKEDYLLEHSSLLTEYIDRSLHRWKSLGEGCRDVVLPQLGNALLRFLKEYDESDNRIVVKTPRAFGIKNFPQLFPDGKLVLLVRDGRDVVESAARTFTWEGRRYWMKQWKEGANLLLDFMRSFRDTEHIQWEIVRYEHLVDSPREAVPPLLELLGCDPASFNWDAFDRLPVRGSSDVRAREGKVHWKPVEKSASFQPVGRWKNWNRWDRWQFKRICGREMKEFGYDC